MASNTGKRRETPYPTLKDVARKANTSTATVSYVLNGTKDRYVTDELRQRVLKAAKELNYSKSLVASGLKGKSRRILTLLIPQISNIFFARIALAIERYAFEKGYIVHICNTFDDPVREKLIIEQAISQRVDGIFISGTPQVFENTQAIRAYDIPYVAVERSLDLPDDHHEEPYYFVGSNNLQSGRLAGEYLVQHGHRNLCYIEWMRNILNMTSRRQGFKAAVEPYLKNGGSCVIKSSVVLSAEAGYEITEEMLQTDNPPTAFLYGHHKLAEGGTACLRDHKISIPEEMSVLIIGTAEWVELNMPRFAFVRQPAERIGARAAEILIGLIEQDSTMLPRPVQQMFDCELIHGDTVRDLR